MSATRRRANVTTPTLVIAPDLEALAVAAAARVHAIASAAVKARGVFRIALSGGDTPRALHTQLARHHEYPNFPWALTQVFWGDDRHVGPTHRDSNYRMAQETLLDLVGIDPQHVFRVHGENPSAAAAAEEYSRTLKRVFGLREAELPRFDAMIMGTGEDGHTASLFPGSASLDECDHLVIAPWVEKLNTFRITMTLPVINHAAHLLFFVAGEEKAAATAAALDPPPGAQPPPAALVNPADGELVWMLDQAAARFLER